MKMKKTVTLLLAIVMLFSLCACGSSAAKSEAYRPSASAAAPSYNSNYAAYDSYVEEPAEYLMAAAEESAGLGGFSSSNGSSSSTVTSSGGSSSDKTPEAGDIAVDKIIYSASATVETTDFDDTISKLEALIAQYGGFIESSSVSGNNYYYSSHGYASSRNAEYRIRIPSRDFATVMNSLSTLGNVPYSNTYTENITSQYYDVQARLNAYRTQEQSLLDMMAKADTVSDLLEIQEQLSDVRYHIESLQSKLTNWDRQVSYSTISLSVQEVQEYTPEAKISFGEQLVLALSRGLKAIGEFFRDLLLWLLEALPALLILGAFVVLVFFLVRRIRRSAKVRREKKIAAQTASAPPAPEKTGDAQK